MNDLHWMQYALYLSQIAEGNTAPNPMVGAVLVYEGRIIGQGWHRLFGTAHAEVNCIASVNPLDQSLISKSTMYVTLEPCNHFGKTPPCADLLVQHKIHRVVIACKDSFAAVNGAGIQKLKDAGIQVEIGLLEKEAIWVNRKFFNFQKNNRPYFTLKWAATADGKIGTGTHQRILISNSITNRWVHQLRGYNQAILVGAQTVNLDNPLLDTRNYAHCNPPIKIVLDRRGLIDTNARLLQEGNQTIIYTMNPELEKKVSGFENVQVFCGFQSLEAIASSLHSLGIQSVLVEGGAQVLQSFIDAGIWDEAFQIKGSATFEDVGIAAPILLNAKVIDNFICKQDVITHFVNENNEYNL